MLGRLHVAERGRRVVERKYLVDHRLQPGAGDRAVHRLEHLGRADRDSLHVGALGHDQHRIESRGAGQDADHRTAARANGTERLCQRAGTADLDHVIDAAAVGQFDRGLVPVRRGLVVDAVRGAEFPGARELLVAERCGDHRRAHQLGELQAEDRDTAGALHQHRVAGGDLAVFGERVPRGDAGAGQARAFLVRQMRRQLHHAVFFQHDVFGEHAVDAAAERAGVGVGRCEAAGPALEEIAGHAIAGFHLDDAVADLRSPRRRRQTSGITFGFVGMR